MFSINPTIKPKFDSLSPDLQEAISKQDIEINTLNDLIQALENIVVEK